MAVDSIKKTIGVAFGVCLISSILVSLAYVKLKPVQDMNKKMDKLKNILIAGGIKIDAQNDIMKLYKERIVPVVVELKTGKILKKIDNEQLKPENFDIESLAKNKEFSSLIPPDKDIASIKRRPDYMVVYNVVGEKGSSEVERRIFPIYGRGLWSTMYGLLALDKDMKTIKGFTFYKHEETPGLGGEVDNPQWKALWKNKKIFTISGNGVELKIKVIKGKVIKGRPGSDSTIDGLSGATLTTRGVNNLVRFWMGFDGQNWGDCGYGPYIKKLIDKIGENGNG